MCRKFQATKKVKGFITQWYTEDSLPGGEVVLTQTIFYVAKHVSRLQNDHLQNRDVINVLSIFKSQP